MVGNRSPWLSYSIAGLAAPFNEIGTLKNGRRELFEPGCFHADHSGVFLEIHHNGYPDQRSKHDNFQIWTTPAGLWFRTIIKDPRHHVLLDYIDGAGGSVGVSVGMKIIDQRFEGGIWRVRQARLSEISLTRFPVYKQTFAIIKG